MEKITLPELNAELNKARRLISEKITVLDKDMENISKEEMDRRIEEIKNIQSDIQTKTSLYFQLMDKESKDKLNQSSSNPNT